MDIIERYFPRIEVTQLQQMQRYMELLLEWNTKINLISRKDTDNILIHHLLHSLSITKALIIKDSDTIIDVGTGGGLPGIPLAIMFPQTKFVLIDSVAKKINAVSEMIKELGIENCSTKWTRSEDLKIKVSHIISRAVTNFPEFVSQTSHLLIKNAESSIVYLKGGDLQEEMTPFRKKTKIFYISNFFEEEYFKTKKIIVYKHYES